MLPPGTGDGKTQMAPARPVFGPAFMATDPALFRYPHYHTPQDTPDKIDYKSLTQVTEGLCGTLATLAAE